MRVRVGEFVRSVFYAPYCVALHRGFFADQGLEIVGEVFGDGPRLFRSLEVGEVDIAIAGIVRSLLNHDRGAGPVPVHFARINDRDGFFLLGRRDGFDWPDLVGGSLILFREAPTPWYALRAFLLDRGLDPDRIRVVGDLPHDRAAALFRAGGADFLQAPAPVAEELVREGAALVLRSMGEVLGPLPYSSYCALPGFCDRNPELLESFVRAHAGALRWMREAAPGEVWEAIWPSFPGGDPEVLGRAVERYRAQGTWSGDPPVERDAFQRLAGLMHRGGLISRIAPYELVCRIVTSA